MERQSLSLTTKCSLAFKRLFRLLQSSPSNDYPNQMSSVRENNEYRRSLYRNFTDYLQDQDIRLRNVALREIQELAESDQFKNTLEEPSRLAEHLVSMDAKRTETLASLDMEWFDFGVLEDCFEDGFGLFFLKSQNAETGGRTSLLIDLPRSPNVMFRKAKLLKGHPIAVYGNETEFLDFTAMPYDGSLASFKRIESLSDFTNQEQAVAALSDGAKKAISLEQELKQSREYTDKLSKLYNSVKDKPEGIELAMHINIQKQQDKVVSLEAAFEKAQEWRKRKIEAISSLKETEFNSLKEVDQEYDQAASDFGDCVSFEMLEAAGDKLYQSTLLEALFPWVSADPEPSPDDNLIGFLDRMTLAETRTLFGHGERILKLRQERKEIVDAGIKSRRAFEDGAAEQAEQAQKIKEELDAERKALNKMISMQLQHEEAKSSVGISSTTDIGAEQSQTNLVTGEVIQARIEANRRQQAIEAARVQNNEKERSTDELATDASIYQEMVDTYRLRKNLRNFKVINWQKQTREKGGGEAMKHAVKVINEAMPKLINSEMHLGFEDLHGREMLALRTGVILPKGDLTFRVVDRLDEQGNTLWCYLTDYKIHCNISIRVINHGKWQIVTVLSNDEDHWTYYEQNTDGVDQPVTQFAPGFKTLEQYAKYNELIVAHIDRENPVIASA